MIMKAPGELLTTGEHTGGRPIGGVARWNLRPASPFLPMNPPRARHDAAAANLEVATASAAPVPRAAPARRAVEIVPLTALRGIAALLVVWFHYSGGILPNLKPGAYTQLIAKSYLCVDLFFMLSGFVLVHVYTATLGEHPTWHRSWRHRGIGRRGAQSLARGAGAPLDTAQTLTVPRPKSIGDPFMSEPKRILCYGDSNTFGTATVPRPSGRYFWGERWPGVLSAELPSGWQVIEEGLGSRTTTRDDPIEGDYRNGERYLLPCLLSHQPLDWVAIMLGTNDLKSRFAASARDIAAGVARLAELTLASGAGVDGGAANVLIISPPPLLPRVAMHGELFAGAREKSLELAEQYAQVAHRVGARFLDAGSIASFGNCDGFHLDLAGHQALGRAVAAKVAHDTGNLGG
jgi:lysophospholipase L1-like esterase